MAWLNSVDALYISVLARGIETGFEVGEGRQQILRYARDEMGWGWD
jgi:hypothetical protein